MPRTNYSRNLRNRKSNPVKSQSVSVGTSGETITNEIQGEVMTRWTIEKDGTGIEKSGTGIEK